MLSELISLHAAFSFVGCLMYGGGCDILADTRVLGGPSISVFWLVVCGVPLFESKKATRNEEIE